MSCLRSVSSWRTETSHVVLSRFQLTSRMWMEVWWARCLLFVSVYTSRFSASPTIHGKNLPEPSYMFLLFTALLTLVAFKALVSLLYSLLVQFDIWVNCYTLVLILASKSTFWIERQIWTFLLKSLRVLFYSCLCSDVSAMFVWSLGMSRSCSQREAWPGAGPLGPERFSSGKTPVIKSCLTLTTVCLTCSCQKPQEVLSTREAF